MRTPLDTLTLLGATSTELRMGAHLSPFRGFKILLACRDLRLRVSFGSLTRPKSWYASASGIQPATHQSRLIG